MTTDRFETTFSIAASPDVVWKRLDQQDGEGHWLLPAFEGLGEEIDVETGSRLHVRKVTEPCAGSEIVIVLEHEASGTKVTVSQSGFPAWFAFATDTSRSVGVTSSLTSRSTSTVECAATGIRVGGRRWAARCARQRSGSR